VVSATATTTMPARWAQDSAGVLGNRIPLRLVAVWGALFFNALAFAAYPTVVPIARPLGQLMTQAALGLALLLVLVVNSRGVVRPNLFLVLLTFIGVIALMVSIHNEFVFGSAFRASRLLGFILVLWLTTPWWGRDDMLLLRCHRRCLWAVLGTIVLGTAIAPGMAFQFEGRLSGVLWPIPPTQVAHYAAVLLGTTVVLWGCRLISGGNLLITLLVSAPILVLTHTRTALIAVVAGLLVAGASLFLGHVRVRRTSAMGAVCGVFVMTFFASELMTWAMRGQTTQEASKLTGRTDVWSAVFSAPRPRINDLFGSGLSNQSFNGLPIDNNWVASYLDQGWFGVVVQASILLLLLVVASTRERGPQRAVALFLVVYCLTASFTETGLGTPSPYLLDLSVAASLLIPARQARVT
jgi:hypothetical protein